MSREFEPYAVSPDHPNWDMLTSRKQELYSRSDDVRSPFTRDYTRVLHSLAYRRLKHKTQAFFNAAGNDHICTRMEHVQHVESVSNTITRSLGLNEDLTKAIALAHDLGHAPFGHQGERVIKKLTKEYLQKDFWHEENGVYFVDNIELLENNQNRKQNLNLTYAVRDGIISHCGEVDQNAIKPREELFDLSEFGGPGRHQACTWEGCVVKVSDKIAYLGRDIEDAIRLRYLSDTQKKILQDMARINNQTAINTSVIMHNMIIDLCKNSTPDKGLTLSEVMYQQLTDIKKFNYKYIYLNKRLNPFNKYAELVLTEIFYKLIEYYEIAGPDIIAYLDSNHFEHIRFVRAFAEWLVQYCDMEYADTPWAKKIVENCKNRKIYGKLENEKLYAQAVIDYIAGMTDMYAINAFDELLKN